ncbi:pyridine nucleotide-disulfide oxidoreductase [Pseudoflavonifractor capillosus ATCC 29799]|uniref:Pyridine nucleotide-disulfide oxidoreductase n=1 Tax=Pseudoflavonifractor capillosus ATCC 29799 TaxID=411467 RepID=A6NZT3_9FIRM|nr:NAD(P)-dependent oxidoreductase [Pseudoflavonifractor capillosus]EDM98436.1 pyridine nucleotide-disulfide oxidoreductase [Pseudoflavonifractor capillosus ATCC 29799]
MALHVMDEAARHLGCKKPRCQEGCPIGTNIPEVIRLLKEGKLDEAGWMLFENNPLTTVCSLVCNHESQCEGHCIRGIKEAPVHFSIIENYISTTYANKMVKGPAPSNGRRAAVIGAGPAGLTIAIILARYGYQVTIFDGRDKIGGVMRYGIPDFRLPDAVLDDIAYRHLELKGIKFRPNTYIGNTLTIDDLFRDGYESVFVGAGLWRPNRLNIKGESLGHVSYAINYLANPDAFHLGERVVVIGTGNSAMDCARTAIRKGARHVVCVARGNTIGASQYETSYAKLEGVDFLMNKATLEIRDDGVVLSDNQKREDGSTVTVEGTEKLYPCDSVIIAVSQGAESNLVQTTRGIDTTGKGLLAVDEDGRTSRPGVFAAGDAVNGARTVVEAVANGKRVAEAMHAYMQSLPMPEPDRYADVPVAQDAQVLHNPAET